MLQNLQQSLLNSPKDAVAQIRRDLWQAFSKVFRTFKTAAQLICAPTLRPGYPLLRLAFATCELCFEFHCSQTPATHG